MASRIAPTFVCWLAVLAGCSSNATDASVGDLGDIEYTPGKLVKHSFVIENDQAVPARVDFVRPSCGCVEATVSTEDIPPNGTAVLEVVVRVSGPGPLKHRVSVGYSDDRVEHYTLTGVVHQSVTIRARVTRWTALGRKAEVEFYVSYDVSRRIEYPTLASIDNSIEWEFGDWTTLDRGDLTSRLPARVVGTGTATFVGANQPEKLTFSLGDGITTELTLTRADL